jgi:hypothetical protein
MLLHATLDLVFNYRKAALDAPPFRVKALIAGVIREML